MFHWTDTDVSNLVKFVVQSVRLSAGGLPGALLEKGAIRQRLLDAVAAELGAERWHGCSGQIDDREPERSATWSAELCDGGGSECMASEFDAAYGDMLPGLYRLAQEYGCGCDEIVTRLGDLPQFGAQHVLAWIAVRPNGSCECIEFYKSASESPFTARDEAILRVLSTELLAQGTGESAEAEWDEVEPPVRLPRRQREVLAGLLSGSSVKEIAVQLGISPYTVNDYVKAIYRRYKVSSRGELMAVVHGLRPLRKLQATGPAAPQ